MPAGFLGLFFFFQAEDGIRDYKVTGVQTCALPIYDRLPDAGAAEQADLAALHERRDQIDDLDAGLEHLRLGLEIDELGRLAVDRPALRVRCNRVAFVHRLAQHLEDATERRLADGDGDRLARAHRRHAPHHTLG